MQSENISTPIYVKVGNGIELEVLKHFNSNLKRDVLSKLAMA